MKSKPMSAATTYPIVIAEWPRNNREIVRVAINEYRGCAVIDAAPGGVTSRANGARVVAASRYNCGTFPNWPERSRTQIPALALSV
jgi:hypothetical protein